MWGAKQNQFVEKAALFVAVCFCLLSLGQISRPLRSFSPSSSAVFSAPRHNLTRHALQEVSPRNAQPRAFYAVGILPVVVVIQDGLLPRTAAYVPLWPMQNWPIHRRLAPASADNPEPA